MRAAMSENLPRLKIDEVLDGGFTIQPDRRVSQNSRFGDDVWDFRQTGKKRSDSVPDGRLVIDWRMYTIPFAERVFRPGLRPIGHLQAFVPEGVINELKVLLYLSMVLPGSAFGAKGKQHSKANTVVPSIRALICLFSEVVDSYSRLMEGVRRLPPLIQSVCDMSLEDIQEAIVASGRVDGRRLEVYLGRLASPLMAKFLPRPLEWNRHDLKDADFKHPKKRNDYFPLMPDELFRLLSDSACADVKGFLHLLWQVPQDTQDVPKKPSFHHEDGQKLFDHYVEIRRIDRESAIRTGWRNNSSKLRRALCQKFGVTPQIFQAYLSRVQRACFTLIGMYTGGRYTDLSTFTNNCVGQKYGMPMLFATEVKRKPVDAPEDDDVWPAIPIMLDALACLRHIARVTFNPYLLASTYTVMPDDEPVPLSYGAFVDAMNLYLREVDTSGRWVDHRVSSNSLRHTLAYQLGRLDVNPVYISVQLKHLDGAIRALPADITLAYGSQGELSLQRAMGAERASVEAAREIYALNTPLAGGGATAFKARRREWFQGLMAQGFTEEQLVERLSKQGLPFVAVGGGFCGGKRDILNKDGTKEQPPCLGQLQCNPADCKQALITPRHVQHWRAIRKQNAERAEDPQMLHSKEHFLLAAQKAQYVLDLVDVKA